ncbi:hypothetical protein H310_05542 [Aphanomyces invadans]|uniref:Uncharacterized protein n=1 Tax=Aphanomyces invadans TaxID=157072 RepID=A0A024UBV1_9STRA|nr:hypothetical protein H310_05542 [Aphanomyces invadans]ETW03118.1 hypothetical protein H310_05542 [Aphanomyces invadans]|eukprot:XP_008868502.1 hypothetical protein H310_05542 [Aphanomyces invadans]
MLAQLSRSATRVAGVRALSTKTQYVLPAFPVLLEDLERDAKQNRFIKVSKLTNLFKRVTNKDELNAATSAFKIYERKYIDPVENTAGEFIKAAISQDAGDVALNALANNFRVGLFLNARSLNKLLAYFEAKHDDASIIAAFEATKKFEFKPNAATYHTVVSALIRSGNAEAAAELVQTAASQNHRVLDETKALSEAASVSAAAEVEVSPEAEEEAASPAKDPESKDKPSSA